MLQPFIFVYPVAFPDKLLQFIDRLLETSALDGSSTGMLDYARDVLRRGAADHQNAGIGQDVLRRIGNRLVDYHQADVHLEELAQVLTELVLQLDIAREPRLRAQSVIADLLGLERIIDYEQTDAFQRSRHLAVHALSFDDQAGEHLVRGVLPGYYAVGQAESGVLQLLFADQSSALDNQVGDILALAPGYVGRPPEKRVVPPGNRLCRRFYDLQCFADSYVYALYDLGNRHPSCNLTDPFRQERAGKHRGRSGSVTYLGVLSFGDSYEHARGGVVRLDLIKDRAAVVRDGDVAELIDQHAVETFGTERTLDGRCDGAHCRCIRQQGREPFVDVGAFADLFDV